MIAGFLSFQKESRGSNADHHPGNIPRFNLRSESQRELFGEAARIDERSKHAVPKRESCAEILADLVRGRVMDPMIIGRDENPFERSDIHFEVRVFPKLNANAERVADGALERGQAKDGDWHHNLRDIVDE